MSLSEVLFDFFKQGITILSDIFSSWVVELNEQSIRSVAFDSRDIRLLDDWTIVGHAEG